MRGKTVLVFSVVFSKISRWVVPNVGNATSKTPTTGLVAQQKEPPETCVSESVRVCGVCVRVWCVCVRVCGVCEVCV